MELNQLSCCGLFELENIGDLGYEQGEEYDDVTGDYRPVRRNRAQAIRACKRALREQLADVEPRGRVVFATTVHGMSIAEAALRQLRWRMIKRFRNGNSGNMVRVWMKHLR